MRSPTHLRLRRPSGAPTDFVPELPVDGGPSTSQQEDQSSAPLSQRAISLPPPSTEESEDSSSTAMSQYTRGLKIQVFSDLHLERTGTPEALDELSIPVVADILCLCGDIGNPESKNKSYAPFLAQCADRWKYVFVVSGNHEHYNNTIEKTDAAIRRICETRKNLFFLQRDEVEVEGYVFLGCTLWSDIPLESELLVQQRCSDYKKIFFPHPTLEGQLLPMNAKQQRDLHERDLTFLRDAIARHKGRKRIIVLTHFSPSLDEEFRSAWLDFHAPELNVIEGAPLLENEAAAFNREKGGVLCWFYGHTHSSVDRMVNGIRVMSNQLGYIMPKNEVAYFEASRVVHLDDIEADMSTDYCRQYKEQEIEKYQMERDFEKVFVCL